MSAFLPHWNYFLVILLMMLGFYAVIARGNMVKKIVGLNIFQTSVFMLYISMGKIGGGTAPILTGQPDTIYSNPLPHVLILTAIVVGVSITAVGYALIIRIYEVFGSIEDDEVLAMIEADDEYEEDEDEDEARKI
ncbi:MAG: cation:proton antiporter subunit C [Parvibaculales bacterium]